MMQKQKYGRRSSFSDEEKRSGDRLRRRSSLSESNTPSSALGRKSISPLRRSLESTGPVSQSSLLEKAFDKQVGRANPSPSPSKKQVLPPIEDDDKTSKSLPISKKHSVNNLRKDAAGSTEPHESEDERPTNAKSVSFPSQRHSKSAGEEDSLCFHMSPTIRGGFFSQSQGLLINSETRMRIPHGEDNLQMSKHQTKGWGKVDRRATRDIIYNPNKAVNDYFVQEVLTNYKEMYGDLEPEFPGIISYCARMALEIISNTNCLYHNTMHTMHVTLVMIELLKGKHLTEGGVGPDDFLHCVIAALCHDIGYVAGILPEDKDTVSSRGTGPTKTIFTAQGKVGDESSMFEYPEGASDACNTFCHVDRGKYFVKLRFAKTPYLKIQRLQNMIECTRFPVPKDDRTAQGTFEGLVRAADMIGQLADPDRLLKIPALFQEFQETGTNKALGCGASTCFD
eukprot:GCRY01002223.1.p1 GENE.GCRY01002223.1~~GCRY01002223.1.p1  ORF type:complete len:453 (-),score=26.91 GCRY01002223.1:363-1721(-)